MLRLGPFAAHHPLLFALCATAAWLLLLIVFSLLAAAALGRPYGDAASLTVARLSVTVVFLGILWSLGWLQTAGVARLGRWPVWLIALGGTLYFGAAGLYALFGQVALDPSRLIRLPNALTAVTTQLAVSLSEEISFRGLVLYALLRAWRTARWGRAGAVAVTALLFAVLHLTQVLTFSVSPSAALLLTLQTLLVAFWWGALVAAGGSLWPAVMAHFVGNAAVALQGLTLSIIEPDRLAYQRLLWLSLPLAVLGLGLLVAHQVRPVNRAASRAAE